ncbi:MAG: hypothetical protein IK141_02745 [Clostridia bacterium]|nr:hypothetical protein [Clostridia bacterium]
MKKHILQIEAILTVVIMLAALSACHKQQDNQEYEYFYVINKIVKDDDFFTANVDDYKIQLYDRDLNQIAELPFASYNPKIQVLEIRKDGSIIYFVTKGVVDDEEGIFFINDDMNQILDGIKSIKRIGGNSYQYSTWE